MLFLTVYFVGLRVDTLPLLSTGTSRINKTSQSAVVALNKTQLKHPADKKNKLICLRDSRRNIGNIWDDVSIQPKKLTKVLSFWVAVLCIISTETLYSSLATLGWTFVFVICFHSSSSYRSAALNLRCSLRVSPERDIYAPTKMKNALWDLRRRKPRGFVLALARHRLQSIKVIIVINFALMRAVPLPLDCEWWLPAWGDYFYTF